MKFSIIIKKAIWGENLRQTLLRALILTIVSFVVFGYFLLPTRVDGYSMEPTFYSGHIIFINTLRYQFRKPRRTDIVAIHTGVGRVSLFKRSPLLIKRIVGLPGERIMFQNGTLIINGRQIQEPYVRLDSDWNMPEIEIGIDEFYVVGDNRSMPIHTHAHGRVKQQRITGGPLF